MGSRKKRRRGIRKSKHRPLFQGVFQQKEAKKVGDIMWDEGNMERNQDYLIYPAKRIK